MNKLIAAAILFLAALPASAQTITNPSFETAQPMTGTIAGIGSWNNGPIPGWTGNGAWGSFQPTEFTSLPDGSTVAWSNGGTLSQDLGVAAQPNTTYTLQVYVGHRTDSFGDMANSYTLTLKAGATNLCSSSGTTASIPASTFALQTLTCPTGAAVTGNLSIVLGSGGIQVEFDNLSLTSKSSIVPQPITITVKGQLLWCAICDGTDNAAAVGNLVVAQTGGPSSTQNISADGTVSVSGSIDIAQASLEFTIMLTDASGATQPGATLTLAFPRFELASPGFTLGTITLGVVRIAHTVDASGAPAVRIVDFGPFSLGK